MSSSTWNNHWPTGVIARYLTAAGSALTDPTITVDITQDPAHIPHDQPQVHLTITATCRSCHATESSYRTNVPVAELHNLRADATNSLRTRICGWAQQHAETCLALPHPEHTR